MLTPSEIDLLRQDLKAALSVIGPDEIEDAQGLFRRHGFRSSDFEIFQQGDPSPAFPSPVTGAVVVLRKSNKSAKNYQAGHRAQWLAELETDLKLKIFGD
jgi:hypothetical protein